MYTISLFDTLFFVFVNFFLKLNFIIWMKRFFKGLNVHVKIIYLWFIIPFISVVIILLKGPHKYNNYLMFKQVFWHTIEQKHLYQAYPKEYFDVNHYGPLFSLIIAPFAILPDYLALVLWVMVNVTLLFFAINRLGLLKSQKLVILGISIVEMITSIQNVQFNPMLTSWLLLSFVFLRNNKILLATFFIMAGLYVKIYGIIGFSFLFFTMDKKKFILYLVFWGLVLFILPMLISSPTYIINSYVDWFVCLNEKNTQNLNSYMNGSMIDISAMGFIRRTTGLYALGNMFFLIPAGLLTLLPLFIRKRELGCENFQLTYLSHLLLGVVLFSSSSESPTYVIAVVGFALWYSIQLNKGDFAYVFLLVFVLIFTVLSPTDLFPKTIRTEFFVKYSLKALPCFLAWIVITYQLFCKNFNKNNTNEATIG